MQNIPVILNGYRMTVVDPPAPKMREDGSMVTNREGVTQFVVSVFAKLRPGPGERAPKGEEIKVTLETDPGQGFEEGARVELISPRVWRSGPWASRLPLRRRRRGVRSERPTGLGRELGRDGLRPPLRRHHPVAPARLRERASGVARRWGELHGHRPVR
jgi:hypothetical protein